MSFLGRQTRSPKVFDQSKADEMRLSLPWANGATADFLAATASCSPYLADLMVREGDWLRTALDDPEGAVAEVLMQTSQLETAALIIELRAGKRRIALLTALADLGGVWDLEMVTATLTDFADACVDICLRTLVMDEIRRGKLPGMTEADGATAAGIVALAMGKMGAGELNYSSDIDLICLFDETRFDPDDEYDARAAFIRVTRKMAAILSDTKSGGYVFRTDLRLRPDASVTPVCISMDAAERYYESVGRTWERAAYIKARACAGDVAAGARFLETLTPFVWRKYLDFVAIQDAHDMRLRIRDHKGLAGELKLEGHNMKLGRGGIREIEFFTQTQQLIAGGRNPELRSLRTVDGLQQLAAGGWVGADVRAALTEHYRFHRTVEHRLQMVRDAQTHSLPKDDAEFDRLAHLMGRDLAGLRIELTDRLNDVHNIIEGFFAPDPIAKQAPNWGQNVTDGWVDYPALRTERAREIFGRIKPLILERLQDAAKPEEALAEFDRFLAALPAGVQLFSLFDANPDLTNLIAEISATSPALAQHLSRNSGVLDAVLAGRFFEDWPGLAGLQEDLSKEFSAVDDYEARLSAARRWAKEWHFRIGVHHLRGLVDAQISGVQYAELAETVVSQIFPIVTEEFERKYGRIPGANAAVIAMGSLGAGKLNALSDLDLIVIYEADTNASSHGKRSLPTRVYFARLTQALITALTVPMADGRLYEVDMRLRPSGKQGPVATSLAAFETYQRDDAWTWEHLALTRARVVAGDKNLSDNIERIRVGIISEKSKGETIEQDVADMRTRLADAKATGEQWDMKTGAGRQQDIELFAQMLALRCASQSRATQAQLASGVGEGLISAAEGQTLREAYDLMWQVQSAGRLLAGGILQPDLIGEGGRRFVLRETKYEDLDALRGAIRNAAQAAEKIIEKGFGR